LAILLPDSRWKSGYGLSSNEIIENNFFSTSVPDPDPPDPHVFGPPGSSYYQAKIVRKALIPTVCDFFWTFYLRKIM
jgi:hypothetical protein